MNRKMLLKIALTIALLFHVSALIGILFTPYKDWFVKLTSLNIILMVSLLEITHPSKTRNFFIFFFIILACGFLVEVIGVNTHVLFGNYTYGEVLGFKFLNVPVIIGINWYLIIYCTAMVTQSYENYMLKKIRQQGIDFTKRMQLVSFITDAALLAVFFDWMMEPVAVKLGYWQWQDGKIPLYNYVCWILISVLMLAVFRKLSDGRRNIFAVHLFIIQLLFFLVLRTFL